MLTLPPSVRVYVASDATDMRRGFDRLSGMVREVVQGDPMSGHLFVFINRRKDQVKVLVWDRTGYVLLHKRLERGCFHLPRSPRPGQRHIEV
jgi:transposase